MFHAGSKRKHIFRCVALITVICFIAYDIAWAYPADGRSRTDTLAQETLFSSSDKAESFARVEAEYIAVSIRKRFEKEPLAGVEDVFRYLFDVGPKFGIDVKKPEGGGVKGQFFAYISSDVIFRFFNPRMRNLSLPADDLVVFREYPINDYLSFQLLRTENREQIEGILASRAFEKMKSLCGIRPVLNPEQEKYSRYHHVMRVTEAAKRLASVVNGRGREISGIEVEILGLCHDLGSAPFAKNGKRALKKAGFNFDETEAIKESIRTSGLNLSDRTLKDLLNMQDGKYGEISDEARILIMADRLVDYIEDIVFAIQLDVLSPDDVPEEILKAFSISSMDDLLEEAETDFDKAVLRIVFDFIEKDTVDIEKLEIKQGILPDEDQYIRDFLRPKIWIPIDQGLVTREVDVFSVVKNALKLFKKEYETSAKLISEHEYVLKRITETSDAEMVEIASRVDEEEVGRDLPAGSILEGYKTVLRKFEEKPFKGKGFQKERERYAGRSFSYTTVKSELDGLVKLGILETDRSKKTYEYRLKKVFVRGPPSLVRGIRSLLKGLSARPKAGELAPARKSVQELIVNTGIDETAEAARRRYESGMFDPVIRTVLTFWPDRDLTSEEKDAVEALLPLEDQKKYFEQAIGLLYHKDLRGRRLYLGKLAGFLAGVRGIEEGKREDHFDDGDGEFFETGMDEAPRRAGERSATEAKAVRQALERLPSGLHWVSGLFYGYWPAYFKVFSAPGLTHRDALALLKKGKETFFGLLPEKARLSLLRDYEHLVEQIAGPLRGTAMEDLIFVNFIAGLWRDILRTRGDRRESQEALVTGLYYNLGMPLGEIVELTRQKKSNVISILSRIGRILHRSLSPQARTAMIREGIDQVCMVRFRSHVVICTEDRLGAIVDGVTGKIGERMERVSSLAPEEQKKKLRRFNRWFWAHRISGAYIGNDGRIKLPRDFSEHFKGTESVILIADPGQKIIEIWPRQNISRRVDLSGGEVSAAGALRTLARNGREFRDLSFSKERFRPKREGIGIEKLSPEIITGELDTLAALGILESDASRVPHRYVMAEVWKRAPPEQFRLMELLLEGLADCPDKEQLEDIKRIADFIGSVYGWELMNGVTTTERFTAPRLEKLEEDIFSLYDGGYLEGPPRLIQLLKGHAAYDADMAEKIARRCGYDEKRAALYRVIAAAHDLGKAKTGKNLALHYSARNLAQMTDNEKKRIHDHTGDSLAVLKKSGIRLPPEAILTIAVNHEPRLRETLKKVNRQLGIRVNLFSVADAFCALTERRLYPRTIIIHNEADVKGWLKIMKFRGFLDEDTFKKIQPLLAETIASRKDFALDDLDDKGQQDVYSRIFRELSVWRIPAHVFPKSLTYSWEEERTADFYVGLQGFIKQGLPGKFDGKARSVMGRFILAVIISTLKDKYPKIMLPRAMQNLSELLVLDPSGAEGMDLAREHAGQFNRSVGQKEAAEDILKLLKEMRKQIKRRGVVHPVPLDEAIKKAEILLPENGRTFYSFLLPFVFGMVSWMARIFVILTLCFFLLLAPIAATAGTGKYTPITSTMASEEAIDANYLTRTYDDGTVASFCLDGIDEYINSRHDTDGTIWTFAYDGSWNLTEFITYYPDGSVEKVDPVQEIIEEWTPGWTFARGANYWEKYGYDIGDGVNGEPYEGIATKKSALYQELNRWKGGYLRVFLFCDLRSGVVFDGGGAPISFSAHVYEDMDALMDAANALGIKLIPTLFDYTLADGVDMEGPNPVGEYPELITDPVKKAALINLMAQFVNQYSLRREIVEWDIINEPIEIVWAATATLPEVQSFVADLADMIHIQDPGSVVTVGAQNKDTVLNWNALGLDKYGIHYYDYMGALQPPSGLDGPFSFTELEPTNISVKMDSVYNAGAEGALFWQDDTGFTITDPQADTIQHWNMSAEVKPFAPEIIDVIAAGGRTFTVDWVPYTGALQGSVTGYTIRIGTDTFFVPGAGTSSYAVDLPDHMHSGDYDLSIRTEMPDGQKDSDYSESVTISAGWSPYQWYLFDKEKKEKRGCCCAFTTENTDFDIGNLVPLVLLLSAILIMRRRSRKEEAEAEPVPIPRAPPLPQIGEMFKGRRGLRPRGSILEGFDTLLREGSLRNSPFTRKEFQDRRKKSGEKSFSYSTISSELEGMASLGILHVDKEKKPFIYELAERYRRGPPGMYGGARVILERLSAGPDYDQLERARILLDIEAEKDVLFYYLRRIPEINLELIRLSSERAGLSIRWIFGAPEEEREEKLRVCLGRLEKLREEMHGELFRLEDPSYPLSITGGRNYREEIREKIGRAIELVDIKNESAACASLCAASRLLAEELALASRARKRRMRPRTWFDASAGMYKVLKGKYAKHAISGEREAYVREVTEHASKLTWQAIRTCDRETDSILEEMDWVRRTVSAARGSIKALEETKEAVGRRKGWKRAAGAEEIERKEQIVELLGGLESSLKRAKVREKAIAFKASGFVRELLEIEEYGSALEILRVIASLLEVRQEALESQIDRILTGRLSELRYRIHHRNSFNIWKADRILEFLERGKNDTALGWIQGMTRDRSLKEPEFYRMNNLLQGARQELEKWQKGGEWDKNLPRKYIKAARERLRLTELLNSFMEILRDQYIDARLKGEPAECMDRLFVENFNLYLQFARKNNIGRGSPRLLWTLFYHAAFVSMQMPDPRKRSRKIPNPLFEAFQVLIRALEVDSIPSLAGSFEKMSVKYGNLYKTLRSLGDSGSESLESLNKWEYAELLRALSLDFGLNEEQERELLKAAAIPSETENLTDISRLEIYWHQMWKNYTENVRRNRISRFDLESFVDLVKLAYYPRKWPGEFKERWEEPFVREISSLSAAELAERFLKYFQEGSRRYKDLRNMKSFSSGEADLSDIYGNLLGPLKIGVNAEAVREAKEAIWILREWIYRHWDDTPKEMSCDVMTRSGKKDKGEERSSRPPRMVKKGKGNLWGVFTKKLVDAGLCREEEAREIIRFGIFRIIKGETPRVLEQPRQVMEIYRQSLSETLGRNISRSEIQTYGYFHEKVHELITDDHVKALLGRLRGRLGQEKFARFMRLYQDQHGGYGTEEEFVEELAADYYSEKVIGNPVRLYDSGNKERVSLNRFDRKVYADIEEALEDIAGEIGKQWAQCRDNLVIYEFNEWAKTVPDETRSMRLVREHLMKLLSVNKEKYDMVPFTPARFDHIFRRTIGGILAADQKKEKDFLFLFMLTLQFPFRDAVNYLERAYPSEYKHFIKYAHTRSVDEKDGKTYPEQVMLFMEAHKRTVPEQIISDTSHLFRNSVVSVEGLIRSNIKHLVRQHKDDISRESHTEFGQNSAGHIAEARYSISKMEGNMARLTVEDVRSFLKEMNGIKNALAKDIEVLDGMISELNVPEDQKEPYYEANKRAKDDLHSLETIMTILREEMDFEGDTVTLEHVSGILRQLVVSQRLDKAFVYPRISWLGGLDPVSGARIDCETNSRSEITLRVYLGEVEEFYPVPEKTRDDFEKNRNFAEKCLEARLKINTFDENGKFVGTEYIPMDYKAVGGLHHHDYVFGGVFEPKRPGRYLVTAEARVTGYRYKDAKGRLRYGKFSDEESLWRPSINSNRSGDNPFGDIVFTVRAAEDQTRMLPAFALAGIGALSIWGILGLAGIVIGSLLISHFLKTPSGEQPAEKPRELPRAGMEKLKKEFIGSFAGKKEITWDHKGHRVTATVEYDDIFKVFVVEPEVSYRDSHPELDVLDMPVAQAFIGPEGSFGQIEAEVKLIGGKPAILFNEVHPSRGYRKLKPSHVRDVYRAWAENAIKEIISAAKKAGIGSFYASGKERIRRRYKRQKITIPEVNLWENYEFPFKGKGWKPVSIDLADEKQAELWELEWAGHDPAGHPGTDKTKEPKAAAPIGGGLDAKQLGEFAGIATPEGLIKYLTSTGLFYQVDIIREALKRRPQKLAEFEELLARQDVGGLTRHPAAERKELIGGPFRTGDTRYYVEEVSDPVKIKETLDAWFAPGKERYFERRNWEGAMDGKMHSPGFLAKLQSEKGELLGMAYYYKGPFMFPEEGAQELYARDVYIGEYMEISEEYRERGLGKVLIAKAVERGLNDPDTKGSAEGIFAGHPAEDSEYAEEGKQAKDFFEKLGFREIYYPSTEDLPEDERQKCRFVAISEYMAKDLLDKVRMSVEKKAPAYEQLTLFPLPEPQPRPILQQGVLFSAVSADGQRVLPPLDPLKQAIRETTGASEIVKIDISSTDEIINAIKNGKIVSLDLKALSKVKNKYEELKGLLIDLAWGMSGAFGREDMRSAVREVLQNAFVHGNRMDLERPIFIYLELSPHGSAKVMDVYDTASKEGVDTGKTIGAHNAQLYGYGAGEKAVRALDGVAYYGRQEIYGKNHRNIVGTRTSIEFEPVPGLPAARSAENTERFAARAREIYMQKDPKFVEMIERTGFDFFKIAGKLLLSLNTAKDLNLAYELLVEEYEELDQPYMFDGFRRFTAFTGTMHADPEAKEFVALLGRLLALINIEYAREIGQLNRIIAGHENPDAEANKKPFYDLASGTNPFYYFLNFSKDRKYVFVDKNPFVIAYLNQVKEALLETDDGMEVLEQDILDLDLAPGSVGTLRLCNVAVYVDVKDIPDAWYEKLGEWMAPGGQIIIEFPPSSKAYRKNRPIIRKLSKKLVKKGGWSLKWGHFDGKDFVENEPGFEEIPGLINVNTAYVFTKPPRATASSARETAVTDAKIAALEIHPEIPGRTIAGVEDALGPVDHRCIVTRPSDAYAPDPERLASKYGIGETQINKGDLEAEWVETVLKNDDIVFVITGGAWGACHRHSFDSIITLIDSEKRSRDRTVRADFYFPLKYIYRFDKKDDYELFPERRLASGELEHLEIYTSYLKACGIPYSAYLYGKELDSNCDYRDPQIRIFITDELPARSGITARPPIAESPEDKSPPMGGGLDAEHLKGFAGKATAQELVEYLVRTGLLSQADVIRKALAKDPKKLAEFEKLFARQRGESTGALEPDGVEVSPLFPVVDRKPDVFIAPVMGNLFVEGDRPTLAGRVVRYMYNFLIERRREKSEPSRERAMKILEEGRAVRQGFREILLEKFGIEVRFRHINAESDYHYNGDTRNASGFMLFYNKSTGKYRDPGAEEVRAYITFKPDRAPEIHAHFIDLTQELIKKKIDFSAKAASPNGVYERLDNMIFYIASYHQKRAARIIRRYLKRHDIAGGALPATDADPKVKGLSWARDPSRKESEIWRKISGSSKKASYNMMIAAYAAADYLEKLAFRQDELGDADAAREFRAEALRVRAILTGKEAAQPKMMSARLPLRPEVRIDDDLLWGGLRETIWPLGTRRLKAALKRALSEILEDVKQQVSPTSRNFIIRGIRYIESGDYKDVFRVEAEVDDGRRIKFGCRLIDEENYEDIMTAQEKVGREIDWFKQLRALNGVAIFIKKSYYIEDDFSRRLSRDLDKQDIYGLTIGEFADGVSIDRIDDPAEKEKAYREAIETIIRAWLLTAEKDESGEAVGFYIRDMKGQNLVLQHSDAHLSPVVYVDLGLGTKGAMVWVLGGIREMLKFELGITSGSSKEIEFLRVIPRTIDEFLAREANIDDKRRELILDIFREIEESISIMEKHLNDTELFGETEPGLPMFGEEEWRELLGTEDAGAAGDAEFGFAAASDAAEELLKQLERDPRLKQLVDRSILGVSEEEHDEEKYDYMASGYVSDIFQDMSDPDVFYKVSRMDEDEQGIRYNNEVNIKEAQALVELDKLGVREGIPRLITLGTTPNGAFWMKLKGMEEGEDLAAGRWQELGPLEKIDVFIRVAEILHRMHEAGWTHNDVAPDNILFNRGGQVMLIDFGLARPEGERVGGGHDRFSTGDKDACPQRDIYGLGRTIEHLFIEDERRDSGVSGHDITVSGLGLLVMGMTAGDTDRRTPDNMKDVMDELDKVRSFFKARLAADGDASRVKPAEDMEILPEKRIMRRMETVLPELVNGLITACHRREKIVLAVDEELAGGEIREQLGRLIGALKDRAGGNDQLAYFLKNIVIRYGNGKNLAAGLESVVQNGDGSVRRENVMIVTSSENREKYFKGFEGSSTITEITDNGLTSEHYYPLMEVVLFTLFRALARMGEHGDEGWVEYWREKFISCYRTIDNAADLDEDAIWEMCWDRTAECYRTTVIIRLIPGAVKVPDRGVYKKIEELIASAA